jgi:UPF0716 protein FxsA
MRILAFLAAVFIVVPVVELALLLRVGGFLGFWPTLGLVLLTGAAGAALARAQGFRVLARLQSEVAAGRVPGEALLDGVCILLGGVLLLTPGFLTDGLGFTLLLPPARAILLRLARRRIEQGIAEGTIRMTMAGGGGVYRGSRGWPHPGSQGGMAAPPVVTAEVIETRVTPPAPEP